MPLASMNREKSAEVKGGLLSDTNVTGSPCVANTVPNLSMVCWADVEFTTKTSGHLENASIATNNNHLPHCAWSTWMRSHGYWGTNHACPGARGGLIAVKWHSVQLLEISSISPSNCGHQTKLRANDFMRVIPRCTLWSSSRSCRKMGGIITLLPHSKQPSTTDRSFLLL